MDFSWPVMRSPLAAGAGPDLVPHRQVIGLSDSQVIWTNPSASSVCLDKDVDDTVLAQMQSVTKAQEDKSSFLLLPGEISDNFLSWANKVRDADNR